MPYLNTAIARAIYGVALTVNSLISSTVSDDRYKKAQQDLAKNIRRRRKELGLTQEDAAHAMGMATRHFQKVEAGELNITLRTLCRIARALGSEVSELLAPQGETGRRSAKQKVPAIKSEETSS